MVAISSRLTSASLLNQIERARRIEPPVRRARLAALDPEPPRSQIFFKDEPRWPSFAGLSFGRFGDPAMTAVLLGAALVPAVAHVAPAYGATARALNTDAATPETIAFDALFGSEARAQDFDEIRAGQLLTRGMAGPVVRQLQARLTDAGFKVPKTGVYDQVTERVVKSFQFAMGVQRTGKFGPETLRALERAEAAPFLSTRTTGAGYSNGVPIGSIDLVVVDGKPLEIRTAHAYRRMVAAAARENVHITLKSGFRTNEEQTALRNAYLRGRGNLAAKPGFSAHQRGIAVDVNTESGRVYRWLNSHAGSYGFLRTVPSESWHWEYHPPTR